MTMAPREAAGDDSKGRATLGGVSGVSSALLVAGLVGGLLLVAADLSTLIEVRVAGKVSERIGGGDRHSYALVLVGVVALPMAVAATLARSRPAALALAALGLIALVIALAVDSPDVNSSGLVAGFERADASPARGYFLELGGAVLVLLAGAGSALSELGQRR